MKRLLILGCGGFVGSHLLDSLLKSRDFEIEGWDLQSRRITSHLSDPLFTFHEANVNGHQSRLEASIQAADVVIHLAAICNPAEYNTRPLDVIAANFFEVVPIIEMCARHKIWLIYFSTSEVYGRTVSSFINGGDYSSEDLYELREDESPLVMGPIRNQRWTYACSKQLAERIIHAHHAENGLPFNVIRPLNFFGPRMDYIPGKDGEGTPRVLACFMTALMNDLPLQLVAGGHQRRTIVSIHDAINALVRLLHSGVQARNQAFNIGNRDNEVTIRELADRMRRIYADITGDNRYREHPIIEVTEEKFYGAGYEDCDRRMPDLSKAERLLGWRPSIALDDILRETMAWFHDVYVSNTSRSPS